MYDTRQYPDLYDLYRVVIAKSATRERTRTFPSTPTSSDQPCLFVNEPGRMEREQEGIDFDHDAQIRLPAGVDLRADTRGQEPDKIKITQTGGATVSLPFTVIWVSSHFGKHQIAYLKEIPS